MELGNKLKKSRNKKRFAQQYVADQLHVTRQAISNWENGHSYPDIDNLKALSFLYDVSLDELFQDADITSDEAIDSCEVDGTNEENKILTTPTNLIEYGEKKRVLVETCFLSLFVLLTCIIPPLGIISGFLIIIVNRKRHLHSLILLILCIICILVCLYNTFTIANDIFMFFGHSSVKKIA